MRSGVMNEDHGQTWAAGMGTASAGRGRSVQKRAPLFRLWSIPCAPGWACGIEIHSGIKTALFLRHFCVIKRVALHSWPAVGTCPKVDRFLTEMVGGVRRTPANQGFRPGR